MVLDNKLIDRLIAAGQSHLIKFFDTLDEAGQQRYAAELAGIDWDLLQELIKSHVMQKPVIDLPEDLTPAPYFPLQPRSEAEKSYYLQADAAGEELLRTGKVAALTVAGGQGSRLGFDGPKGTYPIAPVSGKTLFQYFAESLLSASRKYNTTLHWYIMTSVVNDGATREFFADNNYFGMSRDQIHFFTQGFMPAIGYDGKLLMSSTGSLALSPDGHGGTLLALRKSGMLDDMRMRGIEFLSYFQVDNPLVPVVSPRFIGLHALENSEMSAIMLSKTNSKEKLGNFCVSGGRTMIIEYSDLPDELAEKRNADGSLAFVAGSPAIHVLSRNFVEKLTSGGTLQLPWHRADKKIASLDADGNKVAPDAPNGVKLESFIFDALPLAEKVMILEGDRAEVFAPTKNATGVDSAESCRLMLTARNARRLELAGVEVPRTADGQADAVIELSPRLVLDDEDAIELVKANGLKKIFPGEVVVL